MTKQEDINTWRWEASALRKRAEAAEARVAELERVIFDLLKFSYQRWEDQRPGNDWAEAVRAAREALANGEEGE